MADTKKPDGQAPTDADGTKTQSTPPAAAAPADGAAPPAKAADGTVVQAPVEGKDGAPPAKPKAPETYALKTPEGAEDYVDQADLEAWGKLARERDWTQEEAQAALEESAGFVTAQLVSFRAQTEADPTYGKDNLEANQQLANRVVERVRPKGHARAESFNRFLKKTGAGNHIELFAFLADLGKMMAEDKPAASTSGDGATQRTAEDVLYGK